MNENKEKAIGFTGTRHGMTDDQKRTLTRFIGEDLWYIEFHHGCCEGSDEEAARIARALEYVVAGHPPINDSYLMKDMTLNDVLYKPKGYISRNHDIVDETNLLIATPNIMADLSGLRNNNRSGTWSTINYAIENKCNYVIIFPDGSIRRNDAKGDGRQAKERGS